MGLEPPVSPDWHDRKPRQRVDTGAWRFGFARRRRMCPRMCSRTASQPRPAWRYESCFVNDLSREISYVRDPRFLSRRTFSLADAQVADSGGSRPRIRDDVAHHSDLISLGVPR